MKKRLKRYVRMTKYLLQWIFLEKIRGLDFSMRDKSLIRESGGVLHGYAKTDEGHAREIFKTLQADKSMRLLDVGCGKGAFLREASKEAFGLVAGIEYSERLTEIAKTNFRRLRLSERIQVFHEDALNFKRYGEYNVFYFACPFNSAIMEKVMGRITESQKEKIWIILYRPESAQIVESYGGKEVKSLYDPVRSYETKIYELL